VPDRTEDAALSRILPLTVGGEPVELRTLTIDESDIWLGKVADAMARIDIPPGASQDILQGLLSMASSEAIDLVLAYDMDGTLGGAESFRARATKREVHHALEVMLSAEDPFGEGTGRSVAVAFGAPSRLLRAGAAITLEAMVASLRGRSTSGRSADTASIGDASAESGAGNNSSSDGSTPIPSPSESPAPASVSSPETLRTVSESFSPS
jgi:hypothetical protein